MDWLTSFKRRTYTVILSVGLIGSAFAWLANELVGTVSPFTRATFAIAVVFTAAAIWLLYSRKLSVRVTEESVYWVIGSVLLGVLVYALYGELGPTLAEVSLFSLYLWFPFIYIFIFLAYESYEALVRSGVLYVLSVVVSLPALFSPPQSRSPLEAVNTLGLSYVSMASIIAVLYFLTRMKDDLRRAEFEAERMKRLAETDPLTETLNRRGLESMMEREMERASRHGLPLSLIVFDLDDFKELNDTYGHDAGDRALFRVARLIEPHLRDTDSFARWGGEEFAILCPNTPLESAHRLADRLRTIIEAHAFHESGHRLSASFGVSAHRKRDSATTLAKRADVALYRAKKRGKNRTEIDH